jgi:hypothetical protein
MLARGRCQIGERQGADRSAPATVPGGGSLNLFQIQTNSNYFKTIQTFTDPKMTFPSSIFFEIKYDFEALERMNNFLQRNFL